MDTGRFVYAQANFSLENPFCKFEHKFLPTYEEVQDRVTLKNNILLTQAQFQWDYNKEENTQKGLLRPETLEDLYENGDDRARKTITNWTHHRFVGDSQWGELEIVRKDDMQWVNPTGYMPETKIVCTPRQLEEL